MVLPSGFGGAANDTGAAASGLLTEAASTTFTGEAVAAVEPPPNVNPPAPIPVEPLGDAFGANENAAGIDIGAPAAPITAPNEIAAGGPLTAGRSADAAPTPIVSFPALKLKPLEPLLDVGVANVTAAVGVPIIDDDVPPTRGALVAASADAGLGAATGVGPFAPVAGAGAPKLNPAAPDFAPKLTSPAPNDKTAAGTGAGVALNGNAVGALAAIGG